MWFLSLSFSRIVLRGQEIVNSVVPQSNHIFDFQKAYRLSEKKVQLSYHLSVPLSWADGLVSPSDGLGHQWRPDSGPLDLEFQSLWFHDLNTCLNFWLNWSRDDAPSVCSFGWLWEFHSQPPSAWIHLSLKSKCLLISKSIFLFSLQALDVSDHFPVEFKLQSSRAVTNRQTSVSSKKKKKASHA